jgi:raffinose/stachyose/melibiose transport system permease protein
MANRHRLSRLERRALPSIYLFLLPTLVIFLVFYLTPIFTVIFTAFSKWDGFNKPTYVGFQNFTRLFERESFRFALRNLSLWGIISMTIHVLIGMVVAFLLFDRFRGWKFVRAVYMIPNVISAAAWAMIYRFVFNNDYGLLNNLIRVVNPSFSVNWFFESPAAFAAVTYTWLFYAVIVSLLVLADLMAIPQELYEAAYIDGADGWQVTRFIKLPLCRNSIGTAIICSGTARISMYEAISLTTRGGPGNDTMNLPILLVNSITDMRYGMANAVALIMFIIGILLLLLVKRTFRLNDAVY